MSMYRVLLSPINRCLLLSLRTSISYVITTDHLGLLIHVIRIRYLYLQHHLSLVDMSPGILLHP